MTSSHILEWSNEMALRLIDEYEGKPELWDNQDDNYRVQSVKYAAWRQLADTFECHPMDVKRKMNSLLTSHRRERCREARGLRSRWFAYDALQFIADKFPMRDEQEKLDEEPLTDDDIEEENQPADPAQVSRENHRYHLRAPNKRKRQKLFKPNTKLKKHRDSCDVFGEYVAQSLRQLDPRTEAIVKHAINNILFETEMKKYAPLNLLDLVEGIDDTLDGEQEVVVEVADQMGEDEGGVEGEGSSYNMAQLKPVVLEKPQRLLNESMS